ncbi:hypothetical protein HUU42_04535 [bacterium]|nr:hypothetical protein [bacterium]
MKTMMRFIAVVLTAGVFASALAAQESADEQNKRVEKILKLAVQNLKVTLKGNNDNLKESAMAVVRDLKQAYPQAKLSGTIIPLMNILRTHSENSMRILAALTLKEIGDDKAFFAISEAAKFDSSSVVRHICASITKSE